MFKLLLLGAFLYRYDGAGTTGQSMSSQGASPPSSGPHNASEHIPLIGAGTPLTSPLYNKWIVEYGKVNRNVSITYRPIGSGAGVEEYKNGTADFAGVDIALSKSELDELPRPTIQIPVAAHAIVPIYSLKKTGINLRFSPEVLAEIFLGKIKKWNDVRIGRDNPTVRLPDLPIQVVHRIDGSVVTHIFTSYLAAVSSEWKARIGFGKTVTWPTGIGGSG